MFDFSFSLIPDDVIPTTLLFKLLDSSNFTITYHSHPEIATLGHQLDLCLETQNSRGNHVHMVLREFELNRNL